MTPVVSIPVVSAGSVTFTRITAAPTNAGTLAATNATGTLVATAPTDNDPTTPPTPSPSSGAP